MTKWDDIAISIAVILVVFTSVPVFLTSKAADAVSISKDTCITWLYGREIVPEQSYDDQKAIDIWKTNKKDMYTEKYITMNQYIWQYLTEEMGLSDVCAAGIFGNMMVECGSRSFNLQPYVYSPGGSYYGLCQWCTSNHHSGIRGGTVEQQLEYLCNTIESEMGSYEYSRFIEADGPETASIIFARWYERCTDPYGRQEEARRAYERFGG